MNFHLQHSELYLKVGSFYMLKKKSQGMGNLCPAAALISVITFYQKKKKNVITHENMATHCYYLSRRILR